MIRKATLFDAYKLFHAGALALAEVERAGVCVDMNVLRESLVKMGERIESNQVKLKSSKTYRVWKETYGAKSNLGSRVQLGKVLFDVMGKESFEVTKKSGRPKTDDKALRSLNSKFVNCYLDTEQLKKMRSTYLRGIERAACLRGGNWYSHSIYNTHLVKTYRSSCEAPNFTNVPQRDPRLAEMIRTAYVPRPGHVLIEADYSALEWKVAACFWRDKRMIEDASSSDLDIHRDMAAKCYRMPVKQVTGDARFHAKNNFVFPYLYGSDYIKISRNLWARIHEDDLKTKDGEPLFDLLKLKGIDRLGALNRDEPPQPGTFEAHIYKVQKWFDNRFPELRDRKKKWIADYDQTGEFQLMTGFVCRGEYTRNQILNTPIQGPAFHILLWSLIQMVNRLRQNKMGARVVGEIHDSLLVDCPEKELDDVLKMLSVIMTVEVREAMPWIIVPLQIEVATTRTNWFEKKVI